MHFCVRELHDVSNTNAGTTVFSLRLQQYFSLPTVQYPNVFCLYDIPIFPQSEVLFEMLTGVHVLTSMCGSDPSGPICEQHLGFWEGNVSYQPICAVLLPARLRSHSDSHRTGPTTGMSA